MRAGLAFLWAGPARTSLACAVTLASYVKELTGAEARWDKTEKTGIMPVAA